MKKEFTLTIYTENQVGLINKIAIMFSRRKISLESFNTSPSEVPNIYRFTIVVIESEAVVKNLVKQIEKIVDVFKVYCDYTVFEATGQGDEINKLLKKLDKFGLIEFVRSSRIAIINASDGIHKKVVAMEMQNPALQSINNTFLDKKDQIFQM
jgi:acetolactate synthase-1/3 small subunit